MDVPKLALAVIFKDEIDQAKRIVKDYAQYFDEVCFAVDQRVDEFQKEFVDNPKVKIFPYTWIDDFADKRNFLASKIESPYYFRIDADDEIDRPELIKNSYAVAIAGNFDIIYYYYVYSQDEDGNCNALHWRETLIKKRPDIYWKKPIHENIFVEKESDSKNLRDPRIKIIHKIDEIHSQLSHERNLRLLLSEFQRDKEKTDPRTISYIGRVFAGMGEWKRAIPFLEMLIATSGWDDDKYYAWIHLASCWHALDNIEQAISCCNEALEITTEFPDAYIKKGELYLDKKQYKKALDWLMYGLVRPQPNTQFVLDPTVYGYRVRLDVALAYAGIGDYEKAYKYFEEAKKMAPNNPTIKEKEPFFKEGFEHESFFKHFVSAFSHVSKKNPSALPSLVECIPEEDLQDERLMKLKNMHTPPKTWCEKTVVIYCGQAWEDWAPPSVIHGIGGSEEAVIYLSQELVKLGYSTTVFNSCGDMKGEYGGVQYRNYYEFNPNDDFNIVICWRGNIFADMAIKAKKKIIWLHDVPYKDQFKNHATFDKLVVLSNFHKSLVKNVPEEKILVSSNGIYLPDFYPNNLMRNRKRIINTSSYDRGIEHLLRMWKDIIAEVPEAELHLFYGWNTWIRMEELGFRPAKTRQDLMELMKQPGVFDHGRVGHKQLVKEFHRSGIWAYPSHFEEINCISAMKAQACGCVPLTTDYAALNETVRSGVKIPGKGGTEPTNSLFKAELLKMLKDPDYQEELRAGVLQHREEFGWDKVALQWQKELLDV